MKNLINKRPFIIYAVLEYIMEKIDGYKKNPENPSTTKASEQISSGFLMYRILSCSSLENKDNVY